MTTDGSPKPRAKKRPAAIGRIVATGVSTATTLGLIGGWGLTARSATPTDQQTPPVILEQRAGPQTIIVRVVRRRAARPAVRRVVRRTVAPPAASARAARPAPPPRAMTRSSAS